MAGPQPRGLEWNEEFQSLRGPLVMCMLLAQAPHTEREKAEGHYPVLNPDRLM